MVSHQLKIVSVPDGFVTEVRDGDSWRPGTGMSSRPIDALAVQQVFEDGFGGAGDGYVWRSTLVPLHGGIAVRTRLEVERAIAFAPAMVLWINALDDLNDRQAHTWRQTILRAPTVNAGGLGGNDLPACYLYDHATQTETICYVPPDALAWAERRFFEWSLREMFQYRPDPRFGLGLLPATPAVTVDLTPGAYTFEWWFTQRARPDIPTPWQAQQALIDTVAPLLDSEPRLAPAAVGWSRMAEQTVADLHHDACWVTVDGVTGLRAYVKGSSSAGRDHDRGFELMTQLDVLHPLLVWSRVTGRKPPEPIVERLLATLPEFDRAAHQFVANHFPPRAGDTLMDTWYFLENALVRLPWVAHLVDSGALRAMFRQALEGARLLARRCNYIFPLFADATDWRARGSLLNPGVGGLYAAGCVLGWQLSGEQAWLDEAARALETLAALPPHMLTHEPQQLSFGAAAARFLARHTFDPARAAGWNRIAADLVRLSLRMGYWGPDPAAPYYDPRGMFQACASLCYPAFKENVETLLPWPELLREAGGPALEEGAFDARLVGLMAAFANLARCHNVAFFDAHLPETFRRGPCPAIPYEDLATTEFPHTATLGKELYGAGEVFWSALLFDALGTCDAPDVLILSLDVPALDLATMPVLQAAEGGFAPEALHYLVYNPARVARQVTATTPYGRRELALEPLTPIRLTVTRQ